MRPCRTVSVIGLVVAVLAFFPASVFAVALPPANDFNSGIDGDFLVYSLPLLGIDVLSTPGQIKDEVVIYTGSGGVPVNTNLPGMDDAYSAVSGVCNDMMTANCTFSSNPALNAGYVQAVDPTGGPLLGDATNSWDTSISALLGFLGGFTPQFKFNQNEDNSGDPNFTNIGDCDTPMVSAQDLCAYARLTLRDLDNSANNLVLEFEAPNHVTSQGFLGTDGVRTLPAEFILAAGAVCLDSAGAQTPCDGSGNPVAIGPVNHNLGADHVAYVIVSPALDAALGKCIANGLNSAECPWEVMSLEFDLDGLSNGFEQLFLERGATVLAPEPGTLMLVGAGLIGLGAMAWRRGRRV